MLCELAAVVPAVRDRATGRGGRGHSGSGGDQYVLFAAVTALLVALAAERPVMIVLDDLHWAYRGTLRLLRHLVGHPAGTAVDRRHVSRDRHRG